MRRPASLDHVAIAYIRVSTNKQELGELAQHRAIKTHAERTGLQVLRWFVERVSGSTPVDQRPELLAAMGELVTCRAGVLLVARRDRLARDVVIAAVAERMAVRVGARIVSAAGEGSDDTGPAGALFRGIVDAFSQYELAMIHARTRAALAARKAKGLRAGGVPWGFRADTDGTLHFEPREQAAIARCAELIAIGHTVNEIVATLKREGHHSRKGNPLPRSKVGAICTRIRRSQDKAP